MSFKKQLWINTDTRQLVQGFLQSLAETNITFTQGDTVPLNIYLLKQLTNNQGRPFQNIELTNETLKVALGRLDEKATGGTFTLSFDGDDTGALPYNDSSSNIDTALNALTSVIAAGGVIVSGDDSGPWTVTFNNDGARSSIMADAASVTPLSDLIVTTVTEGDGSTQEVQVLKLKESPVAVQSTFTIIASPTIAVTEVIEGASGINEIQKVKIDQVCQDGSFTLSFDSSSAVINYGSRADQVVTALESTAGISSGDVAVQKLSDIEYNITFTGSLAGAPQSLIIADSSGLIGFSGFEADLNLGSYAVEQLLNGLDQNEEAVFEVELNLSGDKTTVLKIPAILQNDLIDESVTTPPNNGIDWDALLAEKVTGPASAVEDNLLLFDGTTGKLVKDSGVNITTFTDSLAEKVTGPASAIDGNISTFDATTGKLIEDSGVNISAVNANTAKVTNATHSGDASGDTTLTLATVNANVGSFTNSNITVNAKGLITSASNGTSGAISIATYQDQKASGTAGGSSVTGVQTRTINTEVSDVDNIATLSANAITPIAGRYLVIATSPANRSNDHRIYLHDGTSNVLQGVNAYNGGGYIVQTSSTIWGYISTAGSTAYTIEHEINRYQATNGLGQAVTDGNSEIYTQVTLIRLGDQ